MTTKEERSFIYDQSGDMHPMAYLIAILLSIVIHIALLYFAGNNKIHFMRSVDATVEQRLALREESAIKLDTIYEDPELPFEAVSEPLKDPYDVDVEDLLLTMPTATPGATMEPPVASADLNTSLTPEIQKPPIAETVASPTPWQPREELVTMVDKIVYDEIVPFERRDVPDIERKLFAPDVTLPYEFGKALENAGRIGTPAYVNPAPPKVDDAAVAETLIGGETHMPESVEAGSVASGEEAAEFFKEIPAEVAPAKPIENVLKTTVSVYRPRRSDGYLYFKVDVDRKTEDVLPPLPRDILLVQDASGSLGKERLYFCSQAFRQIIDTLKPTDRLNVLKFNTENSYCFGNVWQSADFVTREAAKAFIDGIVSEGNTDFFNAVKGVLDMPRSKDRVMLVIFASDGRTTAGNLRRDSEIIGEFSKLNNGKVSVFNVGVSKNSNEFLLSMLSFCNRGAAAYISPDRFKIVDKMLGLYQSIANPVLADISFMFDTSAGADVGPKMTTHLYLDRPMQLYGRVPEDRKTVVFQARGVSLGTKYDMVFSLDLDSAEKVGAEAVTDWARAKMYDYVGEYAREPNAMLLYKMNELGRQYDITIPFKDKLF